MRDSLDIYDVIPEAMKNYLRHNGRHFSEKMCEFAVSKMRKLEDGREVKVKMLDKTKLENLLAIYNISLENDVLYDGVYVLNMANADFYGSSLRDESNLIQFVKDYIDDIDQADGFVFNRFYSDCVRKGVPIPWNECL